MHVHNAQPETSLNTYSILQEERLRKGERESEKIKMRLDICIAKHINNVCIKYEARSILREVAAAEYTHA